MTPPVKHSKTDSAQWVRPSFAWPAGLRRAVAALASAKPSAKHGSAAQAGLRISEKKKVIVEIGPGRGDFLFHLAEKNPDAAIVGIEIKPKRIDKLIRRTERRGLKNIFLIQDDARTALPRDFDECQVDEIHINFPDPWPKKRHEKNRAVSTDFLKECARILKTGGALFVATDHERYAEQIKENAARVKGLLGATTDDPEPFPTLFAVKWKSEGRKISYQKYRKEG